MENQKRASSIEDKVAEQQDKEILLRILTIDKVIEHFKDKQVPPKQFQETFEIFYKKIKDGN